MTDGSGLGDVYGATIDRIKAQGGDKSRLGMEALMWISHAERPLKADELCHALAIELDTRDFNAANAPSVSTVVSCCQGLIAIEKEASTVRLIHFTLKEYLSTRSDLFSRPHSAIADICLTYLNSKLVRTISAYPPPSARGMPFLEYCSLPWGAHAKIDLSDRTRSLATQLFREYDGHISVKLLLEDFFPLNLEDFEDDYSPNILFSGLHCAFFFGIVEVVVALIETKCFDINEGGFWGYTPLVWAARKGHEDVVKIILDCEEVNPDKPDNLGETPLSHAAGAGEVEVVKILLGQEEVNPDEVCDEGETPLMRAVWGGHKEVVEILLNQEGVNPNKQSSLGETPLSFAAYNGSEGMVETLLARGEVDPDIPDDEGQTPLWLAARNGHAGVVKILLRHEEVSPDKPDNDGKTPLLCAAEKGHEGVVNLLLSRQEVIPDKSDKDSKTPLSYAAEGGHEGVVKILLERKEVNPDKPDNSSRTPLWHAACGGHGGVVEILLGREEVNPETRDNDGKTPLQLAARNGHEEVVKILLGVKRSTPISEIITLLERLSL